MRIYPAIDIKGGNCVRLFKGRFDDVTVYGDSPAEMAKKWEAQGGEFVLEGTETVCSVVGGRCGHNAVEFCVEVVEEQRVNDPVDVLE